MADHSRLRIGSTPLSLAEKEATEPGLLWVVITEASQRLGLLLFISIAVLRITGGGDAEDPAKTPGQC
jgi:hypothetical protein